MKVINTHQRDMCIDRLMLLLLSTHELKCRKNRFYFKSQKFFVKSKSPYILLKTRQHQRELTERLNKAFRSIKTRELCNYVEQIIFTLLNDMQIYDCLFILLKPTWAQKQNMFSRSKDIIVWGRRRQRRKNCQKINMS